MGIGNVRHPAQGTQRHHIRRMALTHVVVGRHVDGVVGTATKVDQPKVVRQRISVQGLPGAMFFPEVHSVAQDGLFS